MGIKEKFEEKLNAELAKRIYEVMTEVIFWGDDPFESINDVADHFERNGLFEELSDDKIIELEETTDEPIWKFDAESMVEWIHDERFPEDVDGMFDKLVKILNDNIDFDRVNGALPKLAYANGKKFTETVGELKKMI